MQPPNLQLVSGESQESNLITLFLNKFAEQNFIEKIINVSLYQADFSSSIGARSNEVITFVQKFLKSVRQDLKEHHVSLPLQMTNNAVILASRILELRSDVSARLVSYDNITQHFPKRDLHTEKLLTNVKNNRISNITEFKKTTDFILQTIEAYNELKQIKTTLINVTQFINDAAKEDTPLLNLIKNYKEIIVDSYNAVSSLKTLTKQEQISDYILLFDEPSVKDTVNKLVEFLNTGYEFYNTGYTLIDTSLGGIESGGVCIITGPSNHAKSIFMINLARRIIINNINDFQENDAIVFITLEDSVQRLMRRFLSIFGNADANLVRRLFVKASLLLKEQRYKDIKRSKHISGEVSALLQNLIENAIFGITGKKVTIILKHANENTFTSADVTKLLDKINIEGNKVKLLLLDYIDCMQPMNSKMVTGDDYNVHGQIVQELRLVARGYNIPVITITQNSRGSENGMSALTNSMIGDSIKKVRYADTILMIRMRNDLDLLSDAVKKDVYDESSTMQLKFSDMANDYVRNMVPFEVKITKAKEGTRDAMKYHLFSGINTRIYDSLDEFFMDLPQLKNINKKLEEDINLLGNNLVPLSFESDNNNLSII